MVQTATKGQVWVHGHEPAGTCVNVHDRCYHQRLPSGAMFMFKDCTELAQPLTSYITQESSLFTLSEQYSRDGPGGMGVGEPAPRAWVPESCPAPHWGNAGPAPLLGKDRELLG